MIYRFITLLMLFTFSEAKALPSQRLMESPKANLLGGAFTARADDEFTLFYNPAALGRNEGFNLNLLNLNISGSNIINDMDRFKDLPNEVQGVVDRLAERPFHINLGTAPGFKIGSFGFNLILNSKTDFIIKNSLDPEININNTNDKGFVTGVAFGFGRGKISSNNMPGFKKSQVYGFRTSFGVGIKYLDRTSISAKEGLLTPELINLITSGNMSIEKIKKHFGKSRGQGLGLDLGVDHAVSFGRTHIVAGLAVLDVGDTSFRLKDGIRGIKSQKMNINSGVSLRQDFTAFDLILSSDVEGLNDNRDFIQKFKLGAELEFPLFGVYAGLSEGYTSYGVSAHLFPFKITAGFRSREFGAEYKSIESKEFIATVSLFNFSFNL